MTVSYYFKSSYFKRVLKQITKEKFKNYKDCLIKQIKLNLTLYKLFMKL